MEYLDKNILSEVLSRFRVVRHGQAFSVNRAHILFIQGLEGFSPAGLLVGLHQLLVCQEVFYHEE